jgi:hypothetical protein
MPKKYALLAVHLFFFCTSYAQVPNQDSLLIAEQFEEIGFSKLRRQEPGSGKYPSEEELYFASLDSAGQMTALSVLENYMLNDTVRVIRNAA